MAAFFGNVVDSLVDQSGELPLLQQWRARFPWELIDRTPRVVIDRLVPFSHPEIVCSVTQV